MPSAYSIPKLYKDEIEAIVSAGYYSNKSEVVRDALRTFFESKAELRQAAAIELYKKEKVTLSKAAEIAEISIEELKDILADRGIKIRTPKESKPEIKKGVEKIKKLRKK